MYESINVAISLPYAGNSIISLASSNRDACCSLLTYVTMQMSFIWSQPINRGWRCSWSLIGDALPTLARFLACAHNMMVIICGYHLSGERAPIGPSRLQQTLNVNSVTGSCPLLWSGKINAMQNARALTMTNASGVSRRDHRSGQVWKTGRNRWAKQTPKQGALPPARERKQNHWCPHQNRVVVDV